MVTCICMHVKSESHTKWINSAGYCCTHILRSPIIGDLWYVTRNVH